MIGALTAEPGQGASQLGRQLGIEGPQVRDLAQLLRELKDEGRLIETRPGRFAVAGEGGEFPARIERDASGHGLVACFDDGRRLPVDGRHGMGAEEGDEVIVIATDGGQALVVRIVERVGRGLPGSLQFRQGQPTFIPDSRRLGQLPVDNPRDPVVQDYQAGDRVVAKLRIDPDGYRSVTVERVLGGETPEVADFEQVCLLHDLPGDFPVKAVREAERVPLACTPTAEREDLRDTFIFTIDPATAKDFDDAISIERLPQSGYRLGVHIADVSHFVQPDSALDIEALVRGTSIYLVNRVIPMLPERLSNGLCSLVPNEDRYALSVFIDLDRGLRVQAIRPASTLIRSRQRLTYEEALAIIEGEDGDWSKELLGTVRSCHRLAQDLRQQRIKHGAINLFSVERSFVLDPDGHPVSIEQSSGDVAHELIEECMLLANRCISQWLAEQGSNQVFRVHGEPDEDRLEFLTRVLGLYGITGIDVFDRFGLQQVLDRLAQEPPAARLVLNFLCLRCFQKAVYAVRNIGHFALAFSHYVHFTSPIRRYPDLIIHRLVKRALGLADYQDCEERLPHLDAFARQCSFLEQRAERAERDLQAMKAARYLSDRIGETFAGVVTGAGPHGIFVQLMEPGLDGMVPVRDLGDDYFAFDPDRQALIGSRSGQVYGIGLECDVLVVAVDVARAEVTLTLA